jgi:hypothetical protein
MSVNIRKTTGNDAGIVTNPAKETLGDSIASGVNETVDITFANLINRIPNTKNFNFVAPPNVSYNARKINTNTLYALLNQKPLQGGRTVPALISYSPPLEQTSAKLSQDSLNVAALTSTDNQLQFAASAGVSGQDLRPELISVLDLAPMWKALTNSANADSILQRQYTDSGLFLKFQYQTKQLRQDTLLSVIKNVKAANTQNNVFGPVRNDYLGEIQLVQNNLNFYKNVLDNINTIKKSFEIRLIPEENYKINQKNIPSIKKFFIENMKYTEEQYSIFSETKLFLQLLYDFNVRLKNYSFGFLDRLNLARRSDLSPINIDLSQETVGYNFDISNFQPQNNAIINASDPSTFNKFLSLLPIETDSRINLLTYVLAKEYVISSGLGNSKNQTLLKKFNAPNSGNPFVAILGDISNNILQAPQNRNGISSLTYVPLQGQSNVNVLPFETKYINDPNNSNLVWIPGDSYYSEQIIKPSGTEWNTEPYTTYISNYTSIVQNASDIITTLFNVEDTTTAGQTIDKLLNPIDLQKKILQAFYVAFDKVTETEEEVASRLDPAKYLKKLALEQSKKEATEQLTEEQKNIPAGEFEVSRQGGGLNSSGQRDNAYQPTEDGIDKAIDEIKNPPIVKALQKRIDDLTRQINELNVPDPGILEVTTEQALIMSIFNAANSDPDLKVTLFQFCILAGLIRNMPEQKTGLFNILARNEIDTVSKLSSLYSTMNTDLSQAENTSTVDGSKLFNLLKQSADAISGGYQKAIKSESPNNPYVSGFNSGKEITTFISISDISNVLQKAALAQGPFGNVNLIYQYINLANIFFESAQVNGSNVHLLNDNSGRTRLSSLSCSTQLFMLYEIFCQYAKKYSFIKIKGSISQDIFGKIQLTETIVSGSYTVQADKQGDQPDADGTVNVSFTAAVSSETKTGVINIVNLAIDLTNTGMTQKAIGLLTSDSKEEDLQTERSNNIYFVALENNKKKIQQEYDDISNILGIYKVIGDNLNLSLNQVKQFFTQDGLKAFLKSSPITNLNLIKNLSQLRISAQTFQDIRQKTNVPLEFVLNPGGGTNSNTNIKDIEMIVSDAIVPEEYAALEKMLENYKPTTGFGEADIKRNYKILTVGLPSGFTKYLTDKISIRNVNDKTFRDRQGDIIYVNVYVRNAKYPNLIFKPTKLIFDASLFTTKKNLIDTKPQVGERYLDVLNRLSITDFEEPFNPKEVSYDSLKKDPKYNFLNEEQIKELIVNHTNSYLFGLYMSMTTGVKPSEDTFVFPTAPARILNPKARNLIDAYLKQLKLTVPSGESSTAQILANPDIGDDVKDLYRIFTYGSLVFNQGEVISRVLYPKLFDRIFYLPMQMYVMEIDIEKTKLLNPDINALLTPLGNKIIYRKEGQNNKYYLIDGKASEFILKDIFVQIETAEDTRQGTIVPTITQTANGNSMSRLRSTLRNALVTQGLNNNITRKKIF